MKKLTQKQFQQENFINILMHIVLIGLSIYLMMSLKIWLVTVISIADIMVSLYMLARSLRILTNPTVSRRYFIERNDERYALIQDKAAQATYKVLLFLISSTYSFAATLYALAGRELSVSLVVVSVVMLAISVTTNQIAKLVYERIL